MRKWALVLLVALLASLGTYVTASAGVPCCSISWVVPEDDVPCIGETVHLDVYVHDCYGTPLGGIVVHILSDRGSDDVISGSPDTTDVNGRAEATITSMVAGWSWLSLEFPDYGFTCDGSGSINWSGASGTAPTTWGTVKALLR